MTRDVHPLPGSPGICRPFRFGEWLVLPSQHRLVRGSSIHQIEPRVMHVLVCLVSRAGEVLTREELTEAVWPGVVVVEKSLTNVISELRHVLGDDPERPRFIETIRKTGYRWVAPVEVPGAAGETAWPLSAECAGRDESGGRSRGPRGLAAPTERRRAWRRAAVAIAIAIGGLMLVLAVAQKWWLARDSEIPLLEGRPLTSDPGFEIHPALSPDGNWVAYCAQAQGDGDFDIYVKPCDAQDALRLTTDPGHELHPAWSPDGGTLAYVHATETASICTIPAIGGRPRTLLESRDEILGLSWSPDGREIAYGGAPSPGAHLQVMVVDVTTRKTRRANIDSAGYACAFTPRFSPDGRTIAFARSDIAGLQDLYVVDAAGGGSRRVTRLHGQIAGLDWTPDGHFLVFASAQREELQLWRVRPEGGRPTWLPTRSARVANPSLSRGGGRLVFEEHAQESDVWELRVPLGAGGVPLAEGGVAPTPTPLITSTRDDGSARRSPQGDRVAFLSTRSGEREIWLADHDGRNPRRLTDLRGAQVLAFCWSPDGARLACSCIVAGRAALHVLDCESGVLRRVHAHDRHELLSAWSRDGGWLFCEREGDCGWELWRVRIDGSAEEPLGVPASYLLCEAADGELLYCFNDVDAEIWRSRPDGSEAICVVAGSTVRRWLCFDVLERGVYYVRPSAPRALVLGWLGFDGVRRDSLALLPPLARGLHAGEDGTLLFDSPRAATSDLLLVEGFRRP